MSAWPIDMGDYEIAGGGDTQPFWRLAYLHTNALLPAVVVFLALYMMQSVVWAIFLFHGVCLVMLPLLLVTISPRCGRTLEWYAIHIKQELGPDNWYEQLPIACLVLVGVTSVGFVGFVIEESTLDLIPSDEVTDQAQAEGLSKPVRKAYHCSCAMIVSIFPAMLQM